MSTPASPSESTHPVELDLESSPEVARWRVVGNPVMAIPHLIAASALLSLLHALSIVAWLMILFTGNIPRGLFDFMSAIFRYVWRVTSYSLFMREPYPAFDFTPSDMDTGNDPASLSIPYPERLSRGLIFVKWLLVIPNVIVLAFVAIGAVVALIIAWFSVLFNGNWPDGIRSFVVGFMRWAMRVNAYVYLMTDKYPPYRLRA